MFERPLFAGIRTPVVLSSSSLTSNLCRDEALSQQITESLTHSGVMTNFERQRESTDFRRKSEWTQTRKTKWYDLSFKERNEAASQVHAVVFAQLGALAHSMIELGCGLERSCAFVRRMSIRNQLPSSQRTMLLLHLMDRDDLDRRESSLNGFNEDVENEMSTEPLFQKRDAAPAAAAVSEDNLVVEELDGPVQQRNDSVGHGDNNDDDDDLVVEDLDEPAD